MDRKRCRNSAKPRRAKAIADRLPPPEFLDRLAHRNLFIGVDISTATLDECARQDADVCDTPVPSRPSGTWPARAA